MENITDFSTWELDRDIPEQIWSTYLKKYASQFVLFKGKDGTWCIRCRFGEIQPYSLKKGYLSFYGRFPTPAKKTYFLNKIRLLAEVAQEGYDDCVVKFYEKSLMDFIEVLKIRKRLQLSAEERQKRGEQLRQFRLKSKVI